MADKKPSVLIIGGLGMCTTPRCSNLEQYDGLTNLERYDTGFIGRHLALYIHENNLASEVRLVDKVLPQLAWLAPEFEEACSKDKFVQADAARERERPCSSAFVLADSQDCCWLTSISPRASATHF